MEKKTYAVTVDSGTPYTTDDTSRMWAYVMGLLAGSGESETLAVVATNRIVNYVAGTEKDHTCPLRDGRTMRVFVWGLVGS